MSVEDISNEKFGCLRVTARAPDDPACASTMWHVQCAVCGAVHVLSRHALLVQPRRRSCPACRGVVVHHPAFVEMKNTSIAGVRVLERQPNTRRGNAVWRVQCETCQRIFDVEGIRLRSQHTVCVPCRPKRPGTVQRRARGSGR